MSRTAAVLSVLLPLLAGCRGGVRGNGQPATEKRDHQAFTAVDTRGDFDVGVEQAADFSVTVSIDSNLVPLIETRVERGILFIDSRKDVYDTLPGPHVIVKMPHVAWGGLGGSGRLDFWNVKESEPVSLELSGSGDLAFRGEASSVDAYLGGSGAIALGGASPKVTLKASGSGTIDARSLDAREADIVLDGSGDVRATVRGPTRVTLDGSGDIDLYGAPIIEHWSKNGSGDIDVH